MSLIQNKIHFSHGLYALWKHPESENEEDVFFKKKHCVYVRFAFSQRLRLLQSTHSTCPSLIARWISGLANPDWNLSDHSADCWTDWRASCMEAPWQGNVCTASGFSLTMAPVKGVPLYVVPE